MLKIVRQRILFIAVLVIVATVLTAGCADNSSRNAAAEVYLTVTDDSGREVKLPNRPAKVISLSPSFLEPLHIAGLNIIARPSSKYGVPDFAAALPEIGAVTNVNVEQIAALKPDLVIGYAGIHDKLVPVLEGNNIPVLIVKMKTYSDVVDKLKLFGEISGNSEATAKVIADMDSQMKNIESKLTDRQPPRAVILHSTAKSVTALLDGSIAGSTAQLLHIDNIVSGQAAVNKAQDSVPFSLEKLVENNPDMIFVVAMGDAAEIKQRMDKEFAANPAWNSLIAVQKQRIYYLPQNLFLLNPGLHYPEAAAVMAKLAYPEVFADE